MTGSGSSLTSSICSTLLTGIMHRRKYDQSLIQNTHHRHPESSFSNASETYRNARRAYGYDGRKRGATHAWAGTHYNSGHNPQYTHHQRPEKPHAERDPFSSPYVRRSTGKTTSGSSFNSHYYSHQQSASGTASSPFPERVRKVDIDAELERQRQDQVTGESGLFRAARLIGLLLLLSGLGGVFSAKA